MQRLDSLQRLNILIASVCDGIEGKRNEIALSEEHDFMFAILQAIASATGNPTEAAGAEADVALESENSPLRAESKDEVHYLAVLSHQLAPFFRKLSL